MTKTRISHGPPNWIFMNLNHCVQGCSMLNFTLLGLSCSPFPRNGWNITLLWPKDGPHMVLKIGSSWILIIVPRDDLCQISHCRVHLVAPFPRNGNNVALLWPKHAPHMILQIGSSWIIINMPLQGCSTQIFRVLASIWTDIFNFLTQALTHSVTYPRCRAVHLARGQGHS